MQYKVYEVEDKVTRTGKELKKLVLQGDGKQYPDKNVTMWGDHPLFGTICPGQSIDIELDIEDSTTPNPKGGFYKNKTVIGRKEISTQPSQNTDRFTVGAQELKNILMLKVLPTLDRIEALMGKALDTDRPDKAIDKAFEDAFPDEVSFTEGQM